METLLIPLLAFAAALALGFVLKSRETQRLLPPKPASPRPRNGSPS